MLKKGIRISYSIVKYIHFYYQCNVAPFFNRIKMWRKFKGHAVVGAGGVIGPRGKMIIENQPQGKKAMDNRGGPTSSLIRAPPFGQMGQMPRPGMQMPGMQMPGMPPGMPGMNPYMQQQPPRYPNPYGPPR